MYTLQRESISFSPPHHFQHLKGNWAVERSQLHENSCLQVCAQTLRSLSWKYPPPLMGTTTQRGIVMDFMERGSVQSLLTALSGPPPWPLAFRIAHQIALGMNFLHARELMHHDLHPNNVLLDEDLNAKVVFHHLQLLT